MANVPYANVVIANEIEDQFNSHVDHAIFCTVDRSLEGVPGMTKKIKTYFGKVTTPASGSDPAL